MSISVMLRLVPEALQEGSLAGEVELVETGERALVADASQIVSFVLTAVSRAVEERPHA